MDRTLNQSEIATIDTAIVLASSGVFDLVGRDEAPAIGALTRVGGMTLFQRTVFTLQHAGISQILTLVGQEEEQPLRSLIDGDPRLHTVIRWLPVREFPPFDPETWETLANEVKGSCLILGCHMVFSPSLIESLREEGKEGRAVVAVGRPGESGWSGNPGVVMRADPHTGGHVPRVVFWDRQSDRPVEFDEGQGLARVADLVILPARLLGISGSWRTPETSPIRLALEQAAAEGVVQTLSASSHGYQDAREADGLHKAEHILFRSLQRVEGTLDGVVDRCVNRRVSRPLSRLFMKLRFSPNLITLLSMVTGLMGAACFATGSYRAGITGALLFQLAVILDCCDGEVARLTFAESRLGQALDLVSDNIVHVAVFVGIAWGAYQDNFVSSGYLPLVLGGIAVLSTGASLWCVNRVKSLKANALLWRRMRQADRTRFDFILGRVANRDFSIVVLACACLGVLPWFLWLVATGTSVFAVMMAWSLYRVFAFQRP